MTDTVLKRHIDQMVSTLPTNSPIFLPTDKIKETEKLTGIRRVKEIYDDKLDQDYRPKVRALREQYAGQDRCFIIGNGPSLNKTDLSQLQGEVTFAVNGFFLKAKDLNWLPTFYVVEDHLVAEDRRDAINAFSGPTKLFPAYLAYCFEEAEDTIFFDHQPRKSYPHGFDFSVDASDVTYAGCTVTFTCMQLAFYLGFKNIYLIGVDSDYALPKDLERGGKYGVGILDMKSDDPNHFHPDYFGKGYRWHDPQVERMIEAYEEARRVVDETDQRIYNATVGGKLEVFDRKAYGEIFPNAQDSTDVETLNSQELKDSLKLTAPTISQVEQDVALPRVLIFDFTRRGDGTATGELKAQLFQDWTNSRYLQFFVEPGGGIKCNWKEMNLPASHHAAFYDHVDAIVEAFDPEVILYRPVPNNIDLHKLAMRCIRSRKRPLAVWVMDDWPNTMPDTDPAAKLVLQSDFAELLVRADRRFVICDAMAAAYSERYGGTFTPLANGVDPNEWPHSETIHRYDEGAAKSFVVRYAGSLAENMTLESVRKIAEAVESLAQRGTNIRFEIKTRPLWKDLSHQAFKNFSHTHFTTEDLSTEEYRNWICSADALVIAYNFDTASVKYVRYSLANKLPECMASGVPILCVGPDEVETVRYATAQECCARVRDDDVEAIGRTLEQLISNPELRASLAARAREVAFSNHNVHDARRRLGGELSEIARKPTSVSNQNRVSAVHERSEDIRIDECELIAQLQKKKTGPENVMIDVGAHFGESAKYFLGLNWRVICFEPDQANRKVLESEHGSKPNLTIDTRALGETVEKAKPLFVSGVSSGISGLHDFHESHVQSGTVDVTTLSEIVEQYGLDRLDFLKIDVEGFDFQVLKGHCWDRIYPEVIVCEVEDSKTIPLGYTWQDVVAFLEGKGYTIYISEWHPVVRYGVPHDWCQIIRHPEPRLFPGEWGNIIAFKDDPGPEAVYRALDALTHKPAKRATLPPFLSQAPAVIANWLRANSPFSYRVARSTYRGIRRIGGRQ